MCSMTKIKTSIALDEELIKWVDLQIEKKRFANRTHAIEYALQQLVDCEKSSVLQPAYFPQSYDLILREKPSKKKE